MYRLVFCGCVKAFDVTHTENLWFKMIQEGISDNMANCFRVRA
jgi:pentatricopeptide repeat protein